MEPLLGIIGLILLIGICACIDSHNKKLKKIENLKNQHQASLFMALNHFNGLSIAENTLTQIFSCPNEYEFWANNTSFKLEKNKVTDISITSNIDIQKSYSSSVGGTIGGAVLFGPLGAMIGGRTKEKTSRIINNYLIFSYLDNNEIKYIAFHCSSVFIANKFIKEFKKNNQNTTSTTINL
ncbi:MAG: hypothetical protein HFJ53_01965 [Clostridia bacterium]|nr:hypothetical protein [Clostridia bacterium]